MALILKDNATYTYKGLDIANPYLVIDFCNGSKCPSQKFQHFTVHIYTSQEDRSNHERIIFSKNYNVTGDDWETYFSVAAIKADDDQYSRAYAYIKQVEINTGTIQEPHIVFEWADWEDLL